MVTAKFDFVSEVWKIGLRIMVAGVVTFSAMGANSEATGAKGKAHVSSTEQCILCHGTDLTVIHQEPLSSDLTGCFICHRTGGAGGMGGRPLWEDLEGATFDCLSCHAAEDYDATLNDCQHDDVISSYECLNCHYCFSHHGPAPCSEHDGLTSHEDCGYCHVPCPDE
jgi:hypothetical protein